MGKRGRKGYELKDHANLLAGQPIDVIHHDYNVLLELCQLFGKGCRI